MIAVKNHNHISLFFVDSQYQNMGVGKTLYFQAEQRCRSVLPELDFIKVNSSLFAVPIYRKLGFTVTKPEQEINGIRFVEMQKPLLQGEHHTESKRKG